MLYNCTNCIYYEGKCEKWKNRTNIWARYKIHAGWEEKTNCDINYELSKAWNGWINVKHGTLGWRDCRTCKYEFWDRKIEDHNCRYTKVNDNICHYKCKYPKVKITQKTYPQIEQEGWKIV